MKKLYGHLIVVIIMIFCGFNSQSQVSYDDYFKPGSLRLDYLHIGNSDTEYVELHAFKEDPYWSRGRDKLIEPFDYGTYRLNMFDAVSMKLIFTQSYSTLFEEWRTIKTAGNDFKKFEESVQMPFPKASVRIVLQARSPGNGFVTLKEFDLDPDTLNFTKNEFLIYEPVAFKRTGDFEDKLDILFIPEGYTINDQAAFRKDVDTFVNYILSYDPYNKLTDKINFWYVESFSDEAGTDDPAMNIEVKTILNSSFNTFESDRYLMTESFFKVKDIAANAPYDQIIILVNTEKYGGGGIYNYYAITTSHHQYSSFVCNHEFGHSLAGLADEYVGGVNYESFLQKNVEPWQPNITTLVDFESKWKSMVQEDTPIPTPSLKCYRSKLGVFEGAAYVKKGVYRSFFDCTMRSVSENNFCPVCLNAIVKMIRYYASN